MSGDDRARAEWIAEAALARKGERVVALDVREVASFADTFVLVSGNSDRHVRSIADAIDEAVLAHGEKALGIEGREEGRWILIDLGDVIVHVFQTDVREHYDLERLWSDAPTLELSAEGAPR